MSDVTRRAAIAIGVAAATTSLAPRRAQAQSDSGAEGKEIFPGVRVIELGKRDSEIKAYKTVEMIDVVFQPGSEFPIGEPMEFDMVCQTTEGQLHVQAGDMEFDAKPGDVWSCGKGSTREGAKNNGDTVAVMRVIYLKA